MTLKTILGGLTALTLALSVTSCTQKTNEIDEADDALAKAKVLVVNLTNRIDIAYPISAAAHGYESVLPVILVSIPDPKSDYRSNAQTIIDTIGDVDYDVKIVYETDSELTEADKQNGSKDPKDILARYDVKTGKKEL